MKIRNKVISGLVLSAVLTSGLFAMNGEMNKKDGDRKGCDFKNSMMHKKGEGHILGMFKSLNLTPEQESQIEKIVLESSFFVFQRFASFSPLFLRCREERVLGCHPQRLSTAVLGEQRWRSKRLDR